MVLASYRHRILVPHPHFDISNLDLVGIDAGESTNIQRHNLRARTGARGGHVGRSSWGRSCGRGQDMGISKLGVNEVV